MDQSRPDVRPALLGRGATCRRPLWRRAVTRQNVSASRSHTVGTALKLGIRSVRPHPVLAMVFLAATLSQGALQGLLVWVLRDVLRSFSLHGSSLTALAYSAGLVLAIWLLRSAGTYIADI